MHIKNIHNEEIQSIISVMNDNIKLKDEIERLKERVICLEKNKRKPGRPKKIYISNSNVGNNNISTQNNIGKQEINQNFLLLNMEMKIFLN